jgi:hypothetical protein
MFSAFSGKQGEVAAIYSDFFLSALTGRAK